jgi:hypothetical protein
MEEEEKIEEKVGWNVGPTGERKEEMNVGWNMGPNRRSRKSKIKQNKTARGQHLPPHQQQLLSNAAPTSFFFSPSSSTRHFQGLDNSIFTFSMCWTTATQGPRQHGKQGASRPSQSSSTQSSLATRPRQQQLPSLLQHLTAWTEALPKALPN